MSSADSDGINHPEINIAELLQDLRRLSIDLPASASQGPENANRALAALRCLTGNPEHYRKMFSWKRYESGQDLGFER